jgi:ABC-type transport system involved in cytochrome bd biosynthesis fused ATPase/permease subunit
MSSPTDPDYSPLRAEGLGVRYDKRSVIDDLDIRVPPGSFTVIIGPNACGKSTLLRALAGLLPAATGSVLLDGRDIASFSAKDTARRLGLLPQGAVSPEGITGRAGRPRPVRPPAPAPSVVPRRRVSGDRGPSAHRRR